MYKTFLPRFKQDSVVTRRQTLTKGTLTTAQYEAIVAAVERGDKVINLDPNLTQTCTACGKSISGEYEKCYACHFYGKDSFSLKRRNGGDSVASAKPAKKAKKARRKAKRDSKQ